MPVVGSDRQTDGPTAVSSRRREGRKDRKGLF